MYTILHMCWLILSFKNFVQISMLCFIWKWHNMHAAAWWQKSTFHLEYFIDLFVWIFEIGINLLSICSDFEPIPVGDKLQPYLRRSLNELKPLIIQWNSISNFYNCLLEPIITITTHNKNEMKSNENWTPMVMFFFLFYFILSPFFFFREANSMCKCMILGFWSLFKCMFLFYASVSSSLQRNICAWRAQKLLCFCFSINLPHCVCAKQANLHQQKYSFYRFFEAK